MDFLGWTALIGAVLLAMALSSAYLSRLPVSTALVYLLLGIAIGPIGVGLLRIDLADAPWLERLTEVAVIVSLFFGGLKLRLPLRDPAWRPVFRLAGPLMIASIAAVALIGHFALRLSWGSALVLGAVLAPTDPVLASAVTVNDSSDHDRVRFGLSGEAGLNDGMAFPFLVFGLQWIEHGGAGDWTLPWVLHRLVWAVPAALAFGYLLGVGAGRIAIAMRAHHRARRSPTDLLALALIALSYTGAEAISAWGFLAVFAAGVGLRRAELGVVQRTPHPEHETSSAEHPPAETLAGGNVESEALQHPAIAAGALVYEAVSFGDTVERLLEVLVVVLLGASLHAIDWRALPLALVLFVIIRPALAVALLAGTPTSRGQRWLMGWFGIRGIGSIYYLCYALAHGVPAAQGAELAALVLPVLALSVILHGASAQPVLARYERRLAKGTEFTNTRLSANVNS
jgi:NhaP-type Na+/H+ or K+/H+ antiporter